MQTLLRCENIAVGFDGKAVVENVNFELCEGDLLCIVGENGTGKTTLMNAVLGLVPLMNGTIQMCELKKGEIFVFDYKGSMALAPISNVQRTITMNLSHVGAYVVAFTQGKHKKYTTKVIVK